MDTKINQNTRRGGDDAYTPINEIQSNARGCDFAKKSNTQLRMKIQMVNIYTEGEIQLMRLAPTKRQEVTAPGPRFYTILRAKIFFQILTNKRTRANNRTSGLVKPRPHNRLSYFHDATYTRR